jgi:predicted transcriptional regulator with HTH domain
LAGQFIPSIHADTLPGGLLERLSGSGLSERLVQLLVLIYPVTTATSSMRVCADPQNM